MKAFKKIVLSALVSVAAITASLGIAACTDKNANAPLFKNPSVNGSTDTFNGTYVLNITSVGGLKLDGVEVSAKKSGVEVAKGRSINGQIEFKLDPDVYDLVVNKNTLPEGYYVPANAEFKTEADSSAVNITIRSKVIETTAPLSHQYSRGDVMYDFSFTDTYDVTHTLSDLFDQQYSAVLLNFWYIGCQWCEVEFPILQKSYEKYSDKVAVVALSNQNTASAIKQYQAGLGYTFFMGYDSAGLTNMFSVNAFPTSVMIDRYGIICYYESEAITEVSRWNSLFSKYTSSDYVQDPTTTPDPSTPPAELDRIEPTIKEQPAEQIAAAVNGQGVAGKISDWYPATSENDAKYSWPWITGEEGGKTYIEASNKNVNYSFSIINCDLSLAAGDMVSFEYMLDIEDSYDYLYVLINEKNVADLTSVTDGWVTKEIYVATRDVNITLSFCYLKDEADPSDKEFTDTARIRNLTIKNLYSLSVPIDALHSAADGDYRNGRFEQYQSVVLADKTQTYTYAQNGGTTSAKGDGYYHIQNSDGTLGGLLFVDMLSDNAWTDAHVGSSSIYIPSEGINVPASMYYISFYNYSNLTTTAETEGLIFDYGDGKGVQHSQQIITDYYLQVNSDNGYVPVCEALKQALQAFTKKYCTENDQTYHDDQWLELCYYYRHYNGAHSGESCVIDRNPVMGLSWDSAYTVQQDVTTEVDVYKAIPYEGGGIRYLFTAPKTGVYKIFSTPSNKAEMPVDPAVNVFNGKKTYHSECSVVPGNFDVQFCVYAEATAGDVLNIQCMMAYSQDTGIYNFRIEYVGATYDELRVCSTGEGSFTTVVDPLTGQYSYAYDAIPAVLNPADGIYYQLTSDYDYGSVIYIDFVHQNYFDQSGHTLKEIVDEGLFGSYTAVLKKYYEQSVAGKDKTDALYGMVAADEEIVRILTDFMSSDGDGIYAGWWLSMACYTVHYGA